MKYLIFIGVILPFLVHAQALRDINCNYMYNPGVPLHFQMKTIKSAEGWEVLFKLHLRDSTMGGVNDYTVSFETRESFTAKEGVFVIADSLLTYSKGGAFAKSASFHLDATLLPQQILVAKVTSQKAKKVWVFFNRLNQNHPTSGFLVSQAGVPVLNSWVPINITHSIQGMNHGQPLTVFYYDDNFPAALPAFSESMTPVSKLMKADSIFNIEHNTIAFPKPGLYLIQTDTNSNRGLAVRAENDYPKYSTLENLIEPLIYITTKQEFSRLKQSSDEKKAFDRIILTITKDKERARNFMRNYYQRVELANQYFTSYKEGWKTDRGMIYIVFGLPDEVYVTNTREVWNYKNSQYKASFTFNLSGGLFDPENFVLVRDNKIQQTWYEVIDLWRNVRL